MALPEDTEKKCHSLAEKVIAVGLSIFGEAEVVITEKGAAEPKVLALALLARTISNFQGVLLLAQNQKIVEARILARNCCENLLWMGGLADQGEAFTKAMFLDEQRSRAARGKLILQNHSINSDVEEKLRNQLKKIGENSPKAKFLNPKDVANANPAEGIYLLYSQFSADSAHPSFDALGRHIFKTEENGKFYREIGIEPGHRKHEMAITLCWSNQAMLGVCVGANQIIGGSSNNDQLFVLMDECDALAKILGA